MQRRKFIKFLLGAASLALLPVRAFAAIWNTAAFQATQVDVALAGLGVGSLKPSSLITKRTT